MYRMLQVCIERDEYVHILFESMSNAGLKGCALATVDSVGEYGDLVVSADVGGLIRRTVVDHKTFARQRQIFQLRDQSRQVWSGIEGRNANECLHTK